MSELLQGLNPAQKSAVTTLSGPILVLAGAGSGKTKTLTHRIANLIAHGTSPQNILAVTFTNKAAQEMRERLWHLLHPSQPASNRSFMPFMGTFHGIAVRLLHQEYSAAKLDPNFVIYDADDQISLIKHIIKNLNINDKTLKPKSVQSAITRAKNQGISPTEYLASAYYPNQKQIAKIYAEYEIAKTKASALDFDDLLLKLVELFKHNPAIRAKWQNRFTHILIDEYQDTNTIQYQIIQALVNKERNLCVVGDDWQSIYSWRGADFTNILNFERDFPGAKVIKLEQNYRSTGHILNASNKVINHNKTRTDKKLFTSSGEGDPVTIQSLRDETDEAYFVIRQIQHLAHTYSFGDFAILYRTNAQSYAFEKALLNATIPYKIIGGLRFYDRKEVKDLLAVLRLLVNPLDRISLERVLKNLLSGIGPATLMKIFNFLDQYQASSLEDTTRHFSENFLKTALSSSVLLSQLSSRAKNSIIHLAEYIQYSELKDNPTEIADFAISHFGLKELLDDHSPTGEERFKNLEVLLSNLKKYQQLSEFLADAALMSSADESGSKNSVNLMTIHAAKGLEFPVVFIVGLEEGLFPSSRSTDESSLEEERRLAYVGMTRAMQKLFLTYARSRFNYSSYKDNDQIGNYYSSSRSYTSPSRFLSEIGHDPYGSNQFFDEESPEEFDPFPEDLPIFE